MEIVRELVMIKYWLKLLNSNNTLIVKKYVGCYAMTQPIKKHTLTQNEILTLLSRDLLCMRK